MNNLNNLNGLFSVYQQMQQSPDRVQFIRDKFGVDIPQNMNNPYELMQFCMNKGLFNQAQVNSAMQLRPMIQQMFRK